MANKSKGMVKKKTGCYRSWNRVPKGELAAAVNVVFDPPWDEIATTRSDRADMVYALKEKEVTLKEMCYFKIHGIFPDQTTS